MNPTKKKMYFKVLDFYNRFTDPKKICNTTFFLVDSTVDLDKCIITLSPLNNNLGKLMSYNHLMDNLNLVTTDVFGVITS
jgi:hypothetical protein